MKETVFDFFQDKNIKTILDFGCGRYLKDSVFYNEQGYDMYCVDLSEQLMKISDDGSFNKYFSDGVKFIGNVIPTSKVPVFDAAFINFVLDVTETREKRERIVKGVSSHVKEGGYITLSVISEKGVMRLKTKEKYDDDFGYVFEKKAGEFTFLKGYNKNSFENIINAGGLEIVLNNKNKPILYDKGPVLYAICQK